MATDGSKRSSVAPPPRTLNVQKFAESRASELEALHSIVANRLDNNFRSRRNKRRRTTGYDNREAKKRRIKREKVGLVDKDSVLDLEKVPRRIRRRIELRRNPEKGYCTSGDGTKRLRTHVWHAKRFIMTKLWGFYLPLGLQGRGRGSRAILKRFRNGALVHDASYHMALQLQGPEDSLLSILNMVLVPSPSDQSNDISHSLLSGAIYGSAMLHHVGAPVSQSIAPVTYVWKPLQEKDMGIEAEHHSTNCANSTERIECCSSFRQLWVWIHASAFNEGYDALKFACQKLMDETGVLINSSSLEGQLAKLEVMGVKAFELLRKILHPRSCKILKSRQMTKCSSLEHEDQIPSCAVISLTVDDPRNLLEKKTAVVPEATSTRLLGDALNNVAEENTPAQGTWDEALWDASNGFCPPVEENVLCVEKHQQRLTFFCLGNTQSTTLNNSTDLQRRSCPILLLKNHNQNGLVGWSIILPLSWVKAFWIPLVSNGAHAIGLREKRWIACEVELPYFPSDFPDTTAYSSFMATEAAATDEKAKLRPSSLRALRIPIPPPWVCVRVAFDRGSTDLGYTHSCEKICTRDVMNGDSVTNSKNKSCDIPLGIQKVSFEGFVSRTSSMLSHYLSEIHGDRLPLFPKLPGKKSFSVLMIDEAKLSQNINSQMNYDRNLCFVRVILHAYKEGSFEEGAVVCAPHLSDISVWTSRRSQSTEGGLQIPESSVRSYFKEQSSGDWELQIPEDPIARESNRWPVGFVTTGFVRGSKKLKAEALCEATLLARLREEQWNEIPVRERRREIYLLVRNLRSTAYRLAIATIVLEQQEEDVEFI